MIGNLQIFRKLWKSKAGTSLGIAGLVAGIMCVIYIFLDVADEVSINRFHAKLDKIFVVHAYLEEGLVFTGCPPAVGTALKNEYPEVETTCRYAPPYAQILIVSGENKFMERIAYSDFTLFDIFSFPFIYGGVGEPGAPDRIILTETASVRHFGRINPVGKVVRMDNREDMTVTGVIKDIPGNSSITFDAIIPLENNPFNNPKSDYLTSWYNNSFTTFGLLTNPAGYEKVASTITRRIQEELPESTSFLRAYKFKDMYLYEQKHIRNVRISCLIGFLVLLAAILNFINLNTARSMKQAKETALRKTMGASRLDVVRLIYSDVAMICLLAFLLAIFLIYNGLPLINNLTGKEADFSALFSVKAMIALLIIYLWTVFMAGSYPAIFLSSFSPGQIFNSGFQTIRNRGLFRSILVVIMFAVSMILLTSAVIISRQTNYLQNMDLGFNKDQLIYVRLKGNLQSQTDALKQELRRLPGVLSASIIGWLPDRMGNSGQGWTWEGKDPGFKPLVTSWKTDEELLKTFGAEMDEGDFLDREKEGIVINKTFAEMIGWEDLTGKLINGNGKQHRILGVINDIRFNTLTDKTKPMVIDMMDNSSKNFCVVKISSDQISNTVNFINETCKAIEPVFPVDYGFLGERYDAMLASEVNLKKLVGIYLGFAIAVLCLGLLGMVMFLAEQKTKEIGIRKSMGESIISIIWKLIKPFLISGIIAGVIAIPVNWWVMNGWLKNYANRIDLEIGLFILAVIAIIVIALITVFWQAWRTALKNPVDALRYE